MGKKEKNLFIVASFEDASILRKFAILFIIASIVPMLLLCYIYFQGHHKGSTGIGIPWANFTLAMTLMTCGVLIGYFSIRSLLAKVIEISRENSKAIEGFLSPETLKEIKKEQNEITILSRSFSEVTKKLEENIKSLEDAKKTLQSVMSKVGEGISNMENIDTFLGLIVETMTSALNGRVGTLMLLNEKRTELVVKNVFGANYENSRPTSLKLSDVSPLSKIIDGKRPDVVSGVFLQNPHHPQLNHFFVGAVLCAPLIYRDKVSGIITLTKPEEHEGNFSKEDTDLIFNLCSQTAVALENSKLNRDIEKTYYETISALAIAVDAKDKYSRGHLERVAEYVSLIGKQLGLDDGDLNILKGAARLHDLGKIGIPDEILRKESNLSDEEWMIMRRHPEIGESIIKPIRSLHPLCDLIRHHHEKINGSGYPDGLKGEELSPLVRILTVADVYDALTTERPYRAKRTRQEAIQMMRSLKDEIDQDIIEVFLESLETRDKKRG